MRVSQLVLWAFIVACGARSDLVGEADERGGVSDAGTPASAGSGATAGSGPCPHLPGPTLIPRRSASGTTVCIDATEVTNAQYLEFLATSPPLASQLAECLSNDSFVPPFLWPPTGREHRPVVNVDWCDAVAFCAWAGKHLCGAVGGRGIDYDAIHDPMQSSWFDACSENGTRAYPYGPTYDPLACNGEELGIGDAVNAGELPMCESAARGVLDMSGNVWEWEAACEDATVEPKCRVRGGSFRSDALNVACVSAAGAPRHHLYDDFGFRCCFD